MEFVVEELVFVFVPLPLTVTVTAEGKLEDPDIAVPVIVAVPAETPVINPLDDTVATDGLLEA